MNHLTRRGIALAMTVATLLLVLVGNAAADSGNGGGQRRPFAPVMALTVGGGWTGFEFGDVGTTAGPIAFTSASPIVLKVTDAYCAGDRFRIYDNGQLLGDTSSNPLAWCDFPGRTVDPVTAFTSWYYSHGEFALPAGPHSITIQMLAAPFGPGGAFLRADAVSVQNTMTAKPARWQNGSWTLGASLSYGTPSTTFAYGARLGSSPVTPLLCDWDGNGSKTPGVFVNGTWTIRNSNSAGANDAVISFGQARDVPVCGDWDGNGTETVGVVRGTQWLLRNSNTPGAPDITFTYGQLGDTFVVGDWNNDTRDTPGVYRYGMWYLRNSNSAGAADIVFAFNPVGAGTPVVGDWDGNGSDGVGIVRGDTWFLRN
ncbi:MAG: hypothetical protein KIT87_27660, partial [Anaerolineae bacterium]|nr:hypothetical protein [Anaerolineae bacterium]